MIGLLIITYPGIGSSLVNAAEHVLSMDTEGMKTIELANDFSTGNISKEITHGIKELSNKDGIIMLVDLYGSTHSNIACKYTVSGRIELIAGINLPMLLRIINYRYLKLNELTEKIMAQDKELIRYQATPNKNNV